MNRLDDRFRSMRGPMPCPRCGAAMNHHADKLVEPRESRGVGARGSRAGWGSRGDARLSEVRRLRLRAPGREARRVLVSHSLLRARVTGARRSGSVHHCHLCRRPERDLPPPGSRRSLAATSSFSDRPRPLAMWLQSWPSSWSMKSWSMVISDAGVRTQRVRDHQVAPGGAGSGSSARRARRSRG